MSESMIERVAKAIGDEVFSAAKRSEETPWSVIARAAIKAMREPTPLEMYPGVNAYLEKEGPCRPVAFRAGWNAVIDAALSETRKP